MKEFPEKWCIKCTRQTAQSIYNWLELNKQTTTVYNRSITGGDEKSFVQYPAFNGNHQNYHVTEGHTEITFEQFEMYVLNSKPKPVIVEDYSYLTKLLKKYGIR